MERRVEAANANAEATAAAAALAAPPIERTEVHHPPLAPPLVQGPEELVKAVTAAEASASQIIEAWTSTREQIARADQMWRAVQEEVVRFATWRDDIEPVMDQVQGFIQEARARIEEVPGRVQRALAPAVDAMVTVGEGMSRFAAVSTPPLLPASSRPEVGGAPADDDEPSTAPADADLPVEPSSPDGGRNGAGNDDEDPMASILSRTAGDAMMRAIERNFRCHLSVSAGVPTFLARRQAAKAQYANNSTLSPKSGSGHVALSMSW